MVRSEQEIRDLLSKCEKVSAFGVSKGPCPFSGEVDCCAECTTLNTLKWVLGETVNPGYNAQQLMINTIKKISG